MIRWIQCPYYCLAITYDDDVVVELQTLSNSMVNYYGPPSSPTATLPTVIILPTWVFKNGWQDPVLGRVSDG